MACLALAVCMLLPFMAGCKRGAAQAEPARGPAFTPPQAEAGAPTPGYSGPNPVFSEILPSNASAHRAADGQPYPWVELYNDKEEPIPLQEFALTNDEAAPALWRFPERELPPGGYCVVFLSGQEEFGQELHTGFTLKETDATLYLCSTSGRVCDRISWVLPAIGNLAITKERGAVRYTPFCTPGSENDARVLTDEAPAVIDPAASDGDPVIITELLRANDGKVLDQDGQCPGWVELYNRSQSAVSLLGYGLSNRVGDPARWLFPDVLLQPGEYRLVFLSGKDRHEGELHASFVLDEESDYVALTDISRNRVDYVPIVKNVLPMFSIGRTEDYHFRVFQLASPNEPSTGLSFEAYTYSILAEP